MTQTTLIASDSPTNKLINLRHGSREKMPNPPLAPQKSFILLQYWLSACVVRYSAIQACANSSTTQRHVASTPVRDWEDFLHRLGYAYLIRLIYLQILLPLNLNSNEIDLFWVNVRFKAHVKASKGKNYFDSQHCYSLSFGSVFTFPVVNPSVYKPSLNSLRMAYKRQFTVWVYVSPLHR